MLLRRFSRRPRRVKAMGCCRCIVSIYVSLSCTTFLSRAMVVQMLTRFLFTVMINTIQTYICRTVWLVLRVSFTILSPLYLKGNEFPKLRTKEVMRDLSVPYLSDCCLFLVVPSMNDVNHLNIFYSRDSE